MSEYLHVSIGEEWRQIPIRLGSSSDVVWHYTNAPGIFGILTGKSLWASSASILNDTTEIRYGLDILRSEWDSMGRAGRGVSGEVLPRILDPKSDDFLVRNTFVASASRERDSLNQWVHYSGPEGFAIGFNSTIPWHSPAVEDDILLEQGGSQSLTFWTDVEYEPQAQSRMASELLEFLVEYIESPGEGGLISGGKLPVVKNLVARLALYMKDPAFHVEEEVRCAVQIPTTSRPNVRPGSARLISYVPVVPNSRKDREGGRNFVKGVVTGPGSDVSALDAVSALANQTGITRFEISKSKIPYIVR